MGLLGEMRKDKMERTEMVRVRMQPNCPIRKLFLIDHITTAHLSQFRVLFKLPMCLEGKDI